MPMSALRAAVKLKFTVANEGVFIVTVVFDMCLMWTLRF